MLSFFDSLRDISLLSLIVRLLTAFLCGGVIGLERSYKNRPAGFRTHILICIGAAVASVSGLYLYLNAHLPTDISRIGAQVVSGLGFIGGGTIIVTRKQTIKGLTTAAGLWASGIIGLAIGAGFYEGGLIATVLVLGAEILFSHFGELIRITPEFQIEVEYHQKPALDQVLRYCKDHKLDISNLRITGTGQTQASIYTAVISLRPRRRLEPETLLSAIIGVPGIVSAVLL